MKLLLIYTALLFCCFTINANETQPDIFKDSPNVIVYERHDKTSKALNKSYRLQIKDRLHIRSKVYLELNKTITIDDGGTIKLPQIGKIIVQGLTIAHAHEYILVLYENIDFALLFYDEKKPIPDYGLRKMNKI